MTVFAFKKYLKSEYAKNVITLISGTAFAQMLPILLVPVLTKLYMPQEMGVYGQFVSIAAFLAVLTNLRYEMAILLPDSEKGALDIAQLGFVISTVFSFILLLLVLLFSHRLALLTGNSEIEKYLIFLPIVNFFMGFFNIVNYLCIRQKKFYELSSVTVQRTLVTVSLQLLLGFLNRGSFGLIFSQVISSVNGTLYLFNKTIRDKFLTRISIKSLKHTAYKYRNFPKYSLWGIFFNYLSRTIIVVCIGQYFGLGELGIFLLIQKVLMIPSTFIGDAVAKIYMQQAAEERKMHGNAKNAFDSTVKRLALITIPIFVVTYFSLPFLVKFFLPKAWSDVSLYGRALSPILFCYLVSSPVSTTWNVFEKQALGSLWHLGMLLGTIITIFIAVNSQLNIIAFLRLYSLAMVCFYVVFLIMNRSIAHGKI